MKFGMGVAALAAVLALGTAHAKDPKPTAKTAAAMGERDGFGNLRRQIKPLREVVLAARSAGDDKAEALALCRLAGVYTRLDNQTDAGELLLRASMLARRLEDAELGNKVTRQIRDIW